MKHIGRLRSTGNRLVVIFREIPGDPSAGIKEDPLHALTVEVDSLPDLYQKELQDAIESSECQAAENAGEALARKRFASGENMFGFLHLHNFIRKVAVSDVDLTPVPGKKVALSEINNLVRANSGKDTIDFSNSHTTTTTVQQETVTATPLSAKALLDEAEKDIALAKEKKRKAYILDPSLKKKRKPRTKKVGTSD